MGKFALTENFIPIPSLIPDFALGYSEACTIFPAYTIEYCSSSSEELSLHFSTKETTIDSCESSRVAAAFFYN